MAKHKPDPHLLALAEKCGACLAGKPDGTEPITVVFSINAWSNFDKALAAFKVPASTANPEKLFPFLLGHQAGKIDGKTGH